MITTATPMVSRDARRATPLPRTVASRSATAVPSPARTATAKTIAVTVPSPTPYLSLKAGRWVSSTEKPSPWAAKADATAIRVRRASGSMPRNL